MRGWVVEESVERLGTSPLRNEDGRDIAYLLNAIIVPDLRNHQICHHWRLVIPVQGNFARLTWTVHLGISF